MHAFRHRPLFACLLVLTTNTAGRADLPNEALAAAKKATTFLTDQVSTEGGYLWRYAADLKLREGEGVVDTRTVWVQPPGTPSVGEAFVRLHEATGDLQFLRAARLTAEALRRGQMRSGGWQAMIEFDPERRKRWAYRVDPPREKARDQSSLDDDKTQSALRFLMQLDRVLNFQDEDVHEMVLYALDGLLEKAQLSNGGFPQVWTSERAEPAGSPRGPASYPEAWSRIYPGHGEYWQRPTLNDNLARDVIQTLFLADEIYGTATIQGDTSRYRAAALRLADFLLLAQMPDPQPAWAQQYSFCLQPIWARKFEPPAITGGESQGVIETLMFVYSRTGDPRYLEPIPKALDYLRRSQLPSGRLARFYELETNRPLYFTKDYQLTYDDSSVPDHYGFKVASRVDRLLAAYNRLRELPPDRLAREGSRQPPDVGDEAVRRVLQQLDKRGAWVTEAGLRYHKLAGPVIDMRVTVANLELLAEYLARARDRVSAPPTVSSSNVGSELKLPAMWEYDVPLISPEDREHERSRAQKDPTVVFHDGKWHVFMTVKLPGRSAIEYCSFANWKDADTSPRTILKVSGSDYFCAPQVFYFSPHGKWYLIYQMGVPRQEKMWVAYSTTSDLTDPESWTPAAPILDGGPEDTREVGGLDYWIICDEQRAYLFFTSLNGKMWRMWTDVERFPQGFGHCQVALEARIFEASHTYRLKGLNKYLTIIEEDGRRHYKAYTADRLDGEWTPIADTAERPFAGTRNIRPAGGVEPWTDNVSHGELIRDGIDQTLTVDIDNFRFVFQGMLEKDKADTGYGQFPWRIGMLTPVGPR